ncbi:MAG: serine/threonine-protein kinase [Polyangiales bacterium]
MVSVLRLRAGTVIGQDFKVLRLLAKGGMGAVYIAEQLSTGSERALKVMHPHLLDDQKSRDRFTQEARFCARIESEHVVKVIGAGIEGDDQIPWIAMELIKGEDLSQHAGSGPLPTSQVLEICRQLGHGLGGAHALGIVHRDLKPQNVYIAPSQRADTPFTVKVLDFGISKVALDDGESDTTAAVGSPLWMAPEQAHKGRISPATDVWSFGLMVFRLLTGKNYWRAANHTAAIPVKELLLELLTRPMEPASERARSLGSAATLPPGFDAWFARALERDPARRFANATEAVDALIPVLSGKGSPRDEPLDLSRYPLLADPEETRVAVRAAPRAVARPASVEEGAATKAPPPAAPAAAPPARSRELYVAVGGVVVLSGLVLALLLTR